MDCRSPELRRLSEKGNIYYTALRKKEGHFEYQGYRQLQQLGRYFSITLNKKVTRLYTTVNFLVDDNSEFLERQFPRYKEWLAQEFEVLRTDSSIKE